MFLETLSDNRNWTSGGLNSAHYGFYLHKKQQGGDRAPGTKQSDEHSYQLDFESRAYGYFRWSSVTNPDIYGFSNFTPASNPHSWDSNDELSLIGRLREKVQQTGFNGGNFLGELPQTANLLGGKLGLLHKGLAVLAGGATKPHQRYNKKGKRIPPKVKKPVKGDSLIADSWLEFSFGVRPLIDDVYELAKLASTQNAMRSRVRASRKARPGDFYSPWSYANCTGANNYRKQIIVKMEQESLPTFWEQFGLADPATIAWELLPWSFVVDWVLPIGKFVEAQSFARRMKGTFIITEKTMSVWDMNITGNIPGYVNTQLLPESGKIISLKRTLASALDVPLPSLKSNLLGGKPLDRIANALSLLGQVLK